MQAGNYTFSAAGPSSGATCDDLFVGVAPAAAEPHMSTISTGTLQATLGSRMYLTVVFKDAYGNGASAPGSGCYVVVTGATKSLSTVTLVVIKEQHLIVEYCVSLCAICIGHASLITRGSNSPAELTLNKSAICSLIAAHCGVCPALQGIVPH